MSDFSQKTQFDYLHDAVMHKFPGLVNTGKQAAVFQFASSPIAAEWEKSDTLEAYSIANAVSSNLDGFYTQGADLDKAYIQFITTLKPPMTVKNKRYLDLEAEINALNVVERTIVGSMDSDYNLWAANNTDKQSGLVIKGKAAWLLDRFGGASWGKKLDIHDEHIATLTKELTALKKAMGDAQAAALEKASSDKYKMNISGISASKKVPEVSISGSLPTDYARWLRTPKGQYEFDVRIKDDKRTLSPWTTTVKTELHGNCFSLSSKTSVDTSRIIKDERYNLRVTAVGIQTYAITRGEWYEDSLVSLDAVLQEGAQLNHDSFFGLGGTLHMIPQSLLVWYKPSIELTVSTQCYKQSIENHLSLSLDWVELFGFRFAVGHKSGIDHIDNGDGSMTVRFESPDNVVPQIFGVISKVLYNGSK